MRGKFGFQPDEFFNSSQVEIKKKKNEEIEAAAVRNAISSWFLILIIPGLACSLVSMFHGKHETWLDWRAFDRGRSLASWQPRELISIIN